jgi:predicted alpha/beta hydrolase family esterase
MPRSVPTVVVPGWQGSGAGHWQSWLEDELAAAGRETRRPPFASVDEPELADWLAALRATVADLADGGYDVVAHSLGAVLWLHHVADRGTSPQAARVMLVGPPSPATTIAEIAAFFPPPSDAAAVRRGAAAGTVLVAGDDDPYLPEGIQAAYGSALGVAATVLPGAAHINPDSGYGPWPSVLEWCERDDLALR